MPSMHTHHMGGSFRQEYANVLYANATMFTEAILIRILVLTSVLYLLMWILTLTVSISRYRQFSDLEHGDLNFFSTLKLLFFANSRITLRTTKPQIYVAVSHKNTEAEGLIQAVGKCETGAKTEAKNLKQNAAT
ncbi:hypothetical protein M9H77_31622 [Catharanthus roseus]|uniref:Uncharacterized protein n=1 Tax=Catharanthus roseus TaxID=4058 RepID=A0ACC0A1M1_CATRO|nr:hypothetical protein M9H77_31622 [Catharanthus roseus]